MPTARELLEQADALMRRNRALELGPDIPELTDEVAVADHERPAQETAPAPPSVPRQPQRRGNAVPLLDEAAGRVEELSMRSMPVDEGEESRWLEVDLGEASVTGPAPDSIAVVPPSTLRTRPPPPKTEASLVSAAETAEAPHIAISPQEGSPVVPPSAVAALAARVSGTLSGTPALPPPASDAAFDAMLGDEPPTITVEPHPAPVTEPAPPPAPRDEPEHVPEPEHSVVPGAAAGLEDSETKVPEAQQWEGLAEEIRMQVLQRIDIFTDTGLQGELAARLQPIVDRASADLVTTINREVGQILRAYVAEAIEREIEKWRQANP